MLLHIVTHTDVFFHRIVFIVRDIDALIGSVGETSCNIGGILAVILDTLAGDDGHSRGCHDDTLDPQSGKLMV